MNEDYLKQQGGVSLMTKVFATKRGLPLNKKFALQHLIHVEVLVACKSPNKGHSRLLLCQRLINWVKIIQVR